MNRQETPLVNGTGIGHGPDVQAGQRHWAAMGARQDADATPRAWLRRRQGIGATTRQVLDFFDSLAPVTLDEMIGGWSGSGLPSGHPKDGLLEALGWIGTEVIDPDSAHPLLFLDSGKLVAVDFRYVPLSVLTMIDLKGDRLTRALFSLVRPLLRTTEPSARLRMMEHRGKVSATMVYDFLPIHDVFRRVDHETLLGLMDLRDEPQPFFFVLQRVLGPDGRPATNAQA